MSRRRCLSVGAESLPKRLRIDETDLPIALTA
jgi:hypothetical protein